MAQPPSATPWHNQPVHHIALKVCDLEAAERFYHGALQLELVARHEDAQKAPRSVWLRLSASTLLMLEKHLDTLPKAHAGWHLVALTIAPDMRSKVEAFLAAAHIPITGRTDYTLYVQDPEGNRVAFSHWPHPVVP